MKVYNKLISVVLALAFLLSGVGFLGVSAEGTYTQPEKFIYGDVDLDGAVTVKDATLIQKGLAKIAYVTAVQKYLADPNGIGYSVKNATAIQKYLAEYETITPWGVELIIASQDEFSSNIVLVSNMNFDVIRVFPKNHDIEYLLKDFPEFSFNEIEEIPYYQYANGKLETTPYDIAYDLYFNSSSQEELMLAVKVLDYRANIDLDKIELVTTDIPI